MPSWQRTKLCNISRRRCASWCTKVQELYEKGPDASHGMSSYLQLVKLFVIILHKLVLDDEFQRPKRFTKYNLTFEQWPTGHYFPQFCSGPATGETIQTVIKIYERAVQTLDLGLRLEDVLFTGVLRQTAGILPPIDYSAVSYVWIQSLKRTHL